MCVEPRTDPFWRYVLYIDYLIEKGLRMAVMLCGTPTYPPLCRWEAGGGGGWSGLTIKFTWLAINKVKFSTFE
jgi:hypothetical protein